MRRQLFPHRSTGGMVLSLVAILAVLAALALPAGARDSDRQTHGDPAELAVVDSPKTSEGSGGAPPMCPLVAIPTVDTLPTSLRWTVEEALGTGCDQILLQSGTYQISQGPIEIDGSLTISGQGFVPPRIIPLNSPSTIFQVSSAESVTFDNLSFRNELAGTSFITPVSYTHLTLPTNREV